MDITVMRATETWQQAGAYYVTDSSIIRGDTSDCIRMEKRLDPDDNAKGENNNG